MKVSEEMLRKMVQVYRDYNDGIEESFAAALAVLPKMYTAVQVREAMTAAGWLKYQCREVIWRLTQQTPAATEYEHVLGEKAQATQDAEPYITLAGHKARMREAILDALAFDDDFPFPKKRRDRLFIKYGITEPTPAQRVTVGVTHGDAAIYYVDGKVATDEQIKAALIAQLEKEAQ